LVPPIENASSVTIRVGKTTCNSPHPNYTRNDKRGEVEVKDSSDHSSSEESLPQVKRAPAQERVPEKPVT
jgi:hypothetical protein